VSSGAVDSTETGRTPGRRSQRAAFRAGWGRAVAEFYAADDAQEDFVRDFVAAWAKVMTRRADWCTGESAPRKSGAGEGFQPDRRMSR